MVELDRRGFCIGTAASAVAATTGVPSAIAQARQIDGRVAIIDTWNDTRQFIAQLKNPNNNRNIEVIARYMARKPQSILPGKRIAYNGSISTGATGKGDRCLAPNPRNPSEATRLLAERFAILSVYQYLSSSPRKFVVGEQDVRPRIDVSKGRLGPPEAEAKADAAAAALQARCIGQPDTAPIYFGVDFNLQGKGSARNVRGEVVQDDEGNVIENAAALDACLHYFRILKQELGNRPLGVYGNGFINRQLRAADLVAYSWVSESRSFEETAKFLREKDWHLFQHQIDRYWFVPAENCWGKGTKGMSVDCDIQNPLKDDVGAWTNKGLYRIDKARTAAIFDRRWLPTNSHGVAVYRRIDTDEPGTGWACRKNDGVYYRDQLKLTDCNRAVTIVAEHGDWVEVDIDDDGVSDGFCRKLDPTTGAVNFRQSLFEMPDYAKGGRCP